MLFYRVCHLSFQEDGRYIGPYAHNAWKGDWRIIHEVSKALSGHTAPSYPSPGDDGIRSMGIHELCGFTSPNKLIDWFRDEAAALTAAGYVVRVFEALRVQEGRKQAIAPADTLQEVERCSIPDFFSIYG